MDKEQDVQAGVCAKARHAKDTPQVGFAQSLSSFPHLRGIVAVIATMLAASAMVADCIGGE